MMAAGVSYTAGRESESQYGEDLADVRRGDTEPRAHYMQKDKDHFTHKVDPYVIQRELQADCCLMFSKLTT